MGLRWHRDGLASYYYDEQAIDPSKTGLTINLLINAVSKSSLPLKRENLFYIMR